MEEQDLSVGLEVLNLSVRAINCLKRSGIYDVSGLIDLLESEKSLMQIRNLGQKSAKEIVEKLQEYLEAERKS